MNHSDSDVIRAAIEALRQPHLVVEGDCWYTCPLAQSDWSDGSASCNDQLVALGECTCGADSHNARIDAILDLFSANQPEGLQLRAIEFPLGSEWEPVIHEGVLDPALIIANVFACTCGFSNPKGYPAVTRMHKLHHDIFR